MLVKFGRRWTVSEGKAKRVFPVDWSGEVSAEVAKAAIDAGAAILVEDGPRPDPRAKGPEKAKGGKADEPRKAQALDEDKDLDPPAVIIAKALDDDDGDDDEEEAPPIAASKPARRGRPRKG
jgi:hypothetical protein